MKPDTYYPELSYVTIKETIKGMHLSMKAPNDGFLQKHVNVTASFARNVCRHELYLEFDVLWKKKMFHRATYIYGK